MNESTKIEALVNTAMTKLREIADCQTIVGKEVVTADGTTIIPISKVSFGFASGGSDLPTKCKDTFGGGSVAETGTSITYDDALTNGGVITTCISAGKSDVYGQGVEFFNNQPIYSKIVEMGSHVPVVEQSDYHYPCRTYVAAAIINIHNGADIDDELKNAEDQLRFEMGL